MPLIHPALPGLGHLDRQVTSSWCHTGPRTRFLSRRKLTGSPSSRSLHTISCFYFLSTFLGTCAKTHRQLFHLARSSLLLETTIVPQTCPSVLFNTCISMDFPEDVCQRDLEIGWPLYTVATTGEPSVVLASILFFLHGCLDRRRLN